MRRRRSATPQRVGLSELGLARLRERLRGSRVDGSRLPAYSDNGSPQTFAASDYWIEAQIVSVVDRLADGSTVVARFHSPAAAPRGQCRCRICGHLAPPQLVSARGVCIDCQSEPLTATQAELEIEPVVSTSLVSQSKLNASRRRHGPRYTPGL